MSRYGGDRSSLIHDDEFGREFKLILASHKNQVILHSRKHEGHKISSDFINAR